jgi:hypothetical protein
MNITLEGESINENCLNEESTVSKKRLCFDQTVIEYNSPLILKRNISSSANSNSYSEDDSEVNIDLKEIFTNPELLMEWKKTKDTLLQIFLYANGLNTRSEAIPQYLQELKMNVQKAEELLLQSSNENDFGVQGNKEDIVVDIKEDDVVVFANDESKRKEKKSPCTCIDDKLETLEKLSPVLINLR